MHSRALIIAAAAALFPGTVSGAELASVDGMALEQIASRAFHCDGGTVDVAGEVLGANSGRSLSEVWILDADSREEVWRLGDDGRRRRAGALERIAASVPLEPGDYELYVATYPSWEGRFGGGFSLSDLGEMIVDLFGSSGRHDVERSAERLRVTVEGAGKALGENTPEMVRERLARGAVVAEVGVGDDAYITHGLELATPTSVYVYAVGEVTKDARYDSAWIVDADTREPVWQMDWWSSERAGGAKKNRSFSGSVELDAGRYAVLYASDDSHSDAGFTGTPPADPWAWGVTIRTAEHDPAVTTFDWTDPLDRHPIVALTGLGDDAAASEGFTLSEPTEVHVYAVGEGSDGEMYDYGWILDARKRETVWRMDERDTDHAGGGEKNRVAHEIMTLPAGSYLVGFVTDGSHSADGWNTSPPFEPARWGITVAAAADDFEPESVAPYTPASDPAIIARIDKVGDDEHRRATISLAAETEVLVFALGEGGAREMYDYGWIEDASGRTIWDMQAESTEPAGGADKNRLARATITLAPGVYTIHYVSDGSHSYGDWNAAPPADPESWGITLRALGLAD